MNLRSTIMLLSLEAMLKLKEHMGSCARKLRRNSLKAYLYLIDKK